MQPVPNFIELIEQPGVLIYHKPCLGHIEIRAILAYTYLGNLFKGTPHPPLAKRPQLHLLT